MPVASETSALSTAFSYLDPTTFHAASAEQQNSLKTIAKDEFDLSNLPVSDQALLKEALRYSGVEVHRACVVDVLVDGTVGAFLRRFHQQEHRRFNPQLGVLELMPQKDPGNDSTWKPIQGEHTAYPYPFGDQPLIPKLIPVNLSTIQPQEREDSIATYIARPSALLFANEPAETRILSPDDLIVEMSVDTVRKRLTKLVLRLVKPTKVYFAVRINSIKITYEFVQDENLGSNVLSHIEASMKGRLGGVFRPNFDVSTSLQYSDCMMQNSESYLFASVDSIRNLTEDPPL